MRSFGIFAVIALIVMIGTANTWVYFATKTVVEDVHIVKTERIVTDNGSKYLVFTDHEVFENVDEWMALKFNSSDIYGKLQAGKVCTMGVAGLRVQFFSWYRNILWVECK